MHDTTKYWAGFNFMRDCRTAFRQELVMSAPSNGLRHFLGHINLALACSGPLRPLTILFVLDGLPEVSVYFRYCACLHSGPDYPLCRLYHRTMGGDPAARGPPINCQFFTTLCWRLLTTKKGRQLFGRRKVHLERENPGYAYEKRAAALRWYGVPRMVNPALLALPTWSYVRWHAMLASHFLSVFCCIVCW